MKTPEQVVLGELGAWYHADEITVNRSLASRVPELAAESAERIVEQTQPAQRPAVIAVLQQLRDDRQLPLHKAVTDVTTLNWTQPDWVWELFQQLADGIIAQLKAS